LSTLTSVYSFTNCWQSHLSKMQLTLCCHLCSY